MEFEEFLLKVFKKQFDEKLSIHEQLKDKYTVFDMRLAFSGGAESKKEKINEISTELFNEKEKNKELGKEVLDLKLELLNTLRRLNNG